MNLKARILYPGNNLPSSPYLIAEAGVNHEGDMNLAYRLIDEAVEGGADAIKFQTYKAETLASKNSPAYWDLNAEPTPNQFQLFKKYDSFWQREFELLWNHCQKRNIEFLSTPFDFESASFLADMVSVFKISSSDITNLPLIEHICQFGKPILLSTGASELEEIEQTVSFIKQHNIPLGLLHCVLNYPTANENANLGMIIGLKKHFPDFAIGYSDHTLPGDMDVLETASLLGAEILEKHFTFDKSLPGNDHYHAMDKVDIRIFREKMAARENLIGRIDKQALASEQTSRLNARRSLVLARAVKQGEALTIEDISCKRPGTGISPTQINEAIGKKLNCSLPEDSILTWRELC
jgi:N-acetylneuraminate synthase